MQLNATGDKQRNTELAERLVREAAGAGAELVVLPEKWNLLAGPDAMREGAETLDGPTLSAASSWARRLGIHLLAGSIVELREGHELRANTSVLLDPGGRAVAVYRKIHMFDVDVGGVSYRESESEAPGEEIVTAELGDQRVIGLSVCYDLRFPELYRILATRGATVLAVPSAFTAETGRDHWEVLLRARAIENQAFVVAPNQWGPAPPHYRSHGRSAIVDPWGIVLATAPDGDGYALARLDFDSLAEIRERVPSLANRRPQAYAWPQSEEAVH